MYQGGLQMDLSNISVNAQSSIRIEGCKTIYFDPFCVAEERHDADIIFITHEHFDHFQPESIAKVKKDATIIVAPASMEKQIKQESGVDKIELWEPGTTHELEGLNIETIPAYNGLLKPFHPKAKKWQGYLVNMDGIKYYVAGDTDVNDDIKKVKCDVALVPVGGKYTMDKKQAAEYITGLCPKAVVPTHYGEVVGSPADGSDFKKLVEASGVDIQIELKM